MHRNTSETAPPTVPHDAWHPQSVPAMPLSRRLIRLSLFAMLAGAGTSVWASPQSRLDALMKQANARDEKVNDQGQQNERPQQQHDRAGEQRALSDAVRRAERATRGQV